MHILLSIRAAVVGTSILLGGLIIALAARADQDPGPKGPAIVVDDDKQQCPDAQFTDLRVAALAAPPGATILVCPGIYPGPVLVTRPLTFIAIRSEEGQGDGNQRGGNRGDGRGSARARDPRGSSREAIVVAGPVGDGFTLVANSAGTTIDGFVITGGPQPVFDAGINVKDPAGTGYQILGNLLIDNNVGMYFHSAGGAQSRIEGNAFVRNNAGGFPSPNTGTAIYTQGFPINDTEIANNFFEGHTDSALNLGDGSQDGLVIERNTSVNDSTFLVLGRATGSVVSDNHAEGTSASALYFFGQNTDVLVEGNDLEAAPGNTSSGVRLTGPFFGAVGPNRRMSISQNRARNFGYGIRGSNTVDSHLDRNRVRDNTVDGIQMSPAPFTPSAGNTLTDNQARDDGVFDCEDQSRGPGTSGTANFWINDHGKTADPPGICR